MKLKPFKAWLLWDAGGTYFGSVHRTRAEAVSERQDHDYLIDAKWRIKRVIVRPASTQVATKD